MRWPLGRAWAGGRPAETSTARAGERGAKTSDAATRARATSAGRATSLRSARSIPLPSLVRGVTMGRMRAKALLLATALALALPAVASAAAAFRLTSPAFRSGGAIPKRFSCDGADVSPPLRWTAPPRRTRSLVLLVVDTSTKPPYTHWLAWGISPRGPKHRYVFRLYALRTPLKLAAGATARDLDRALRPANVLRRASLAGTY